MSEPENDLCCRICLSKTRANYCSIFVKRGAGSAVEMLKFVLGVTIQKCNALPQLICQSCLVKLKGASSLKKEFFQNEKVLRKKFMQDIVEPPIKDYGVEISDKESEENDSNRLNNEQRVDLPVKQSEEYCLEGKADSRLIISNIQDNCLEIEHDYADDQNERLSMQDEQNDEDQNLIATNIENILIEVEAEELQGENLDKNRAENFEDNFPSCSIKIEKEEIQETFIAQKYLIHDSQIAVLEPYDSKEDEGCNFKSDSERTLMTFNGFNVRVEENFKNINLKPRVVMKAVGRFIYECSNCSYNTSKRDLIINHNMSKHPKKITLKKKKSCELQNPFKINTDDDDVQEIWFHCDLCTAKTLVKSALIYHFQTRHVLKSHQFKYKEQNSLRRKRITYHIKQRLRSAHVNLLS